MKYYYRTVSIAQMTIYKLVKKVRQNLFIHK